MTHTRYRHILRISNAYCFSTATTLIWTRHAVTPIRTSPVLFDHPLFKLRNPLLYVCVYVCNSCHRAEFLRCVILCLASDTPSLYSQISPENRPNLLSPQQTELSLSTLWCSGPQMTTVRTPNQFHCHVPTQYPPHSLIDTFFDVTGVTCTLKLCLMC